MVHYNSWYDFFSYQDEGFNGGFNDKFNANETNIKALRLDKMDEEGCLQRVEAFGTELHTKRGAHIDSFLWDDGWDDQGKTMWGFDDSRFPRRFDVVAEKAASFGAGTGVWLSPWGGYGFPQEARVKYGKEHGYETNMNYAQGVEEFNLAGPKYKKAFTDVALMMRREQGVNMYKFDGVAGDPKHLAEEMENMLKLLQDLRAAAAPERSRISRTSSSSTTAAAQQEKAKQQNDADSIWINLTTGTWASPFFLLWADSIWRGASDIPVRLSDWEPDALRQFGGRLRGRTEVSDGLSRRQRWIRWRNLIVYILVVARSKFFPLSQLMIHGVIVASHGDALFWGLNEYDPIDFAQEVWSFVGMGLQLQELYVAPRYMTSEAWDILAEGLKWARREAAVLRDSHWVFGDPTQRSVYCIASWDLAAQRGFVFLHNPTGASQPAKTFQLSEVLELPSADAARKLKLGVVKSIYRPAANQHADGFPRKCHVSAQGDMLSSSSEECSVAADQLVRLTLLPSEVLVLQVT
eukprot:TRINITY_DN32610_c0_g1_i3.p1 TRINITY_DN32610_c0_g1~~TRINITY_DN32610_c0_g1_i3.p1  ORF type:complete len:521 (-),score=83.41 TRINITY_DN32610_c0_g1_i3:556-2118(-)